MREELVKSFDNTMFQQEKMDNKAYIFIGFVAFSLTYVYSTFESFNYVSWFMFVTMLPLCCSLMPIADKLGVKFLHYCFKPTPIKSINIFYYIDIYPLTIDTFIKTYKKEYDVTDITSTDKKLIEQIIINAKILRLKVFWHNLFQISLIVSVIFIPIIRLVS